MNKTFIERCLGKKHLLKSIIIIIIMLLPGMLSDAVYHGCISCSWVRKMFHFFSVHTGITYQGAFNILKGTIGVVMTMVNLFLAASINIAQRREVHIYGIPRAELEDDQTNKYPNIRRLSYAAPLLIIIFLNMSMCITGYLLYIYCYSFYFIQYRMHERSYNEEGNQTAVVKKILNAYHSSTDAGLLEVQVILEKMKNGVNTKNNWNEMEVIYKKIMEDLPKDDLNGIYNLSGNFFNILFFHGTQVHELEAQKFIRDYIGDFDRKSHAEVTDVEWVKLFAMLEIAIIEMNETELINLLAWLQDFKSRKKELSRRQNESLQEDGDYPKINSHTVQLQRTMVCVLLECRFEYNAQEVKNLSLTKVAKESWLGINTSEYFAQLKKYANFSFHHPMINLTEIIKKLEKDYRNGTSASILANTAVILS